MFRINTKSENESGLWSNYKKLKKQSKSYNQFHFLVILLDLRNIALFRLL